MNRTTHYRRMTGVLFLAALAQCLGVGPLRAADPGAITGAIDKPGSVLAVQAVNRASTKRFPGAIDASTGRFTIAGLPLDADYDCIIDYPGSRLEGVNLKVPRSEYETEQPLSAEDIETIRTKVRALNQFEDVIEIMTVAGNIQHAAVLVNKLRTRPFYDSKPDEIIWRVELWHFERPEDLWVKIQDELFVLLYRERISRSAFDKKSVTFDAGLGGIRLSAHQPSFDLGRIEPSPVQPGIRLRGTGRPEGKQ